MKSISMIADKFLVSEWRQAWKMASLWFYLLLGCAPELFNLAVQYNLVQGTPVEELFAKMVALIAFAGAAARLIKQQAIVKGLVKVESTE